MTMMQVLEGDRPLNLQMFHRDDTETPHVPKLPAALEWPLQHLFAGRESIRTLQRCGMQRK